MKQFTLKYVLPYHLNGRTKLRLFFARDGVPETRRLCMLLRCIGLGGFARSGCKIIGTLSAILQ